jgi:hypothetical protein
MRCKKLNAGKRDLRRDEILESQHRPDAGLDRTMILLDQNYTRAFASITIMRRGPILSPGIPGEPGGIPGSEIP